MTIALIADIHGNLAALEAVLDVLGVEPPDEIVCLGDVAAMGPQPREVLRRLHGLGCPVVMGNADAELLDPASMETTNDDARKYVDMTHWGAAQLDDADDSMIAGHDPTIIAGGHTHIRMLRAYQGREIVNPGSVGLAYQFFSDGSVRVPPWAEFALLLQSDTGEVSIDFRRVSYDCDATVRAMIEREMPHAAWWAAGWH